MNKETTSTSWSGQSEHATACSQTGCSGVAPAPELFSLRGSGCRNLARAGVYEQALIPFPAPYLDLLLLNLMRRTDKESSEEV